MQLHRLAAGRRDRAAIAMALALVLPTVASAQIYKCVDASGHTTYQQTKCPPAAKGGRIELPVDNGSTREGVENESVWESAAREKNVSVGMPRRYVRIALGTPRETRPGRADENAAEVWSYPKDTQILRVGFRNGVVAWTRQDATDLAGEPAPDDEAAQRALLRRNINEGQDCNELTASLGLPEHTEQGAATPDVVRYTWEPAQGDPLARTIVTCTGGRVTTVERVTTR